MAITSLGQITDKKIIGEYPDIFLFTLMKGVSPNRYIHHHHHQSTTGTLFDPKVRKQEHCYKDIASSMYF